MATPKTPLAYRVFLTVMAVLLVLGLWALAAGVKASRIVPPAPNPKGIQQGGRIVLVI